VGEIRELYQERQRYYSACDLTVATDGLSAKEVARQVAELARSEGGF
jgi:shikimate kinase